MDFCDINGRYKKINGFDDYYITEFGEVYSTKLRANEKEPHLRKLKPRCGKRKGKYLDVSLYDDDGAHTKMIHRLVAEHFVDGYFDGAVVNHIDGNNKNNCASNLEWTTTDDNIRKSYDTSGIGAVRNFRWWSLYDRNGELIGTFCGHNELEKFVIQNGIDASPAQLSRDCNSRGYTVIKSQSN